MGNVIHEIKRCASLIRVYWGTPDFDWATVALLMQHQISRTREHIVSHDIVADATRQGRQMRVAEKLLERIQGEPYYEIAEVRYPQKGRAWAKMVNSLAVQDMELLSVILRRHLRSWWD